MRAAAPPSERFVGRLTAVALGWAALGASSALALGPSDAGLHLAPGAVDVERVEHEDGPAVHYLVKEAYPAATTLDSIKKSLAGTGWRPARCSERPRHEGSSHDSGWDEIPDPEGPRGHIWSARWVDAQGNQVVYTLLYLSAVAKHGLQPTHVQVSAWHQDKRSAEHHRMRADAEMAALLRRQPFLRPPDECRE